MEKKDLDTLRNLLTLAYRAGKTKFGLQTAKELIARRYRGFILLADDISPRVKREAFFFQKRGYNVYKLPFDKKNLGTLFGKGEVGVLFLPNSSLTLKIENLLRDLKATFTPPANIKGGSKPKEVTSLATEKIRGRKGYRLPTVEKNIKGEFRTKRSREYKGYRRFKADYRPDIGGFKGSSTRGNKGRKGRSGSS